MKEAEEVKISDLFKPVNNKVLVQVLFGGKTYGNTGILKLDEKDECEPYVIIAAVPPKYQDSNTELAVGLSMDSPIKEGKYALTRKGMSYNTFEMYNNYYALIDEYDIHAILEPEAIEQIKQNIQREVNKQKIQVVN